MELEGVRGNWMKLKKIQRSCMELKGARGRIKGS